ncbi:hypothetical protein KPH14_010124 [Odynerus spinipes]|uniref:Uncharacterized protein n=1 Tax=Odynerus spinipes TaxID=1348599 RepID=A0AAD9VSM0_9HYME|nr:hypothetical protein KPH14_010124 [Odynerus spinipes]
MWMEDEVVFSVLRIPIYTYIRRKMKLYYVLALVMLLTVAYAADVTQDLLDSSVNSAESQTRDKRAPLLGKAALLGGAALVGKKALIVGGAALGAKGLYKAKYYGGGYGGYHGYGGYGYGGHGTFSYPEVYSTKKKKMHRTILIALAVCGCIAFCIATEADNQYNNQADTLGTLETANEFNTGDEVHTRTKRTLFLKKKIIGAGLLGFGLGVAKGYKLGYHSAPEVHRIYVPPPPPPVKYVEYVEKPVYISRFIEKPAPIYKAAHVDYEPSWSQPDPSPHYGSW